MKRVYLVCSVFQNVFVCDDLADAEEMVLSLTEEDAYENFIWACRYYSKTLETYINSLRFEKEKYDKHNKKNYQTIECYQLMEDTNRYSIMSLWELENKGG